MRSLQSNVLSVVHLVFYSILLLMCKQPVNTVAEFTLPGKRWYLNHLKFYFGSKITFKVLFLNGCSKNVLNWIVSDI